MPLFAAKRSAPIQHETAIASPRGFARIDPESSLNRIEAVMVDMCDQAYADWLESAPVEHHDSESPSRSVPLRARLIPTSLVQLLNQTHRALMLRHGTCRPETVEDLAAPVLLRRVSALKERLEAEVREGQGVTSRAGRRERPDLDEPLDDAPLGDGD